MKKLTLPLLLILCLSACFQSDSSDAKPKSKYNIPVVVISEIPIIIHKGCLAKSISTRMTGGSAQNENIEMEVLLDNEYLTSDKYDKHTSRDIELPHDISAKKLTVIYKHEDEIIAQKTVPIQYVETGDEVTYTTIRTMGYPIHILEHACWGNYSGDKIPAAEGYQILYDKQIETRVEGDQFVRILRIFNARIQNTETSEIIEIEPDLEYEYKGKNYLGLKPAVKGATPGSGRKTVKVSGNQKVDIDIGIISGDADGTTRPSYMIQAYEHGEHITARIKDCGVLDTLSSEKIILPEAVQVELRCQEQ